ncbi:MAG: ABC transporter ATP-binding protein [Clostridium sp.]|nr:ABC transporter ATP-binding protein [Clostridium sp.]MCM1444456.1 ABC transporter ATP-binding protein [Candidatus Amulumruptor caecigallinarius]
MNKIISTKSLVKTFSNNDVTQTIINNLDLDIYENDFTIIMGSSGAGKSTLMYCLSGMDRATSGNIIFNNKDICNMNNDELAVFRRKNCGFVFQQIYLLDKMSLMDNVLTSGLLISKDKKEIVKRAKELFKKVNIPEITYKKNMNQVSGGEAQRVGIVRAAINNPTVIFADEPTGALNSENSTAVLDVLTELNKDGQSIIMVTHDKKSALRGNRIIYLKDGKIFGELSLQKYKEDTLERNNKLDEFLREMGW